jgi:hypothetical protein
MTVIGITALVIDDRPIFAWRQADEIWTGSHFSFVMSAEVSGSVRTAQSTTFRCWLAIAFKFWLEATIIDVTTELFDRCLLYRISLSLNPRSTYDCCHVD